MDPIEMKRGEFLQSIVGLAVVSFGTDSDDTPSTQTEPGEVRTDSEWNLEYHCVCGCLETCTCVGCGHDECWCHRRFNGRWMENGAMVYGY